MNENRFSMLKIVGGVALVSVVVIALVAGVGYGGYRLGVANGAVQAQTMQAQFDSRRNATPDPNAPSLPFGRVTTRPYLGVQFEIITADLAKTEKLSVESGAIIRDVIASSPAEKAGLKTGDVISKVNDVTLDKNHSLADLVTSYKVGDEITLTVLRGNETLTLKATLISQSSPQRNFNTPRPRNPGSSG
ncbi:MAG: PDZ domain-containing protein [Chloroflexi bacterium]|nr:PDZ domain-containing protein [Chloroflexota bacterium]